MVTNLNEIKPYNKMFLYREDSQLHKNLIVLTCNNKIIANNIKMRLNIIQRIYSYIRIRNIMYYFKAVPFYNLVLFPKINRYHVAFIALVFGVFVPLIGVFRRPYIFNKFSKYQQSKNQSKQVQLKDIIAKFDIKMPLNVQYMVILNLDELKQKKEEQIDQVDKENSKKIFNLIEEAKETLEARSIKWTFLGSRKLYQIIQNSINKNKSEPAISIQFHENNREKKEVKIYLIAKDQENQQKIIMQWSAGIPYKQISKYIARHKYKKYLKQVNF